MAFYQHSVRCVIEYKYSHSIRCLFTIQYPVLCLFIVDILISFTMECEKKQQRVKRETAESISICSTWPRERHRARLKQEMNKLGFNIHVEDVRKRQFFVRWLAMVSFLRVFELALRRLSKSGLLKLQLLNLMRKNNNFRLLNDVIYFNLRRFLRVIKI